MHNFLRRLASLKFTLVGMGLLGAGSALIYGNPMDVPMWVIVVPLAILALNLSAAIITNPRINHQPGLLLFHVSLLALVVLAGIGRLTHLDAHVELPIGTAFSSDRVLEVRAGVFHQNNMDAIKFVQGPYTVQYAAGLQRGLTHSHVMVQQADDTWQEQIIGDDRPLILENYRFYTTHNKGFTAVLTWIPQQGESVTGTINMPSYPLFEYKQDNRWKPEGGDEIKFWLQLNTGLTEQADWVLDARNSSGVLVVTSRDQRHEITPGQTLRLIGGELRFDNLTMWMGYRIFYDPTIKWMFFISIAGVLGLSQYFWRKINLQPWTDETSEDLPKASDAINNKTSENQKTMHSVTKNSSHLEPKRHI